MGLGSLKAVSRADARDRGGHDCYTVTIPTAWIGISKVVLFDYAVIEFSDCSDFLENQTGWKGIWVAPDSVITGNLLEIYSHPGDKTQPQIRGRVGPETLNGSKYIDFFMDAGWSDSGSGICTNDTDGWPYVVGILRRGGGTVGKDSDPNWGRRITQDVFQFAFFYSAL